MRLTIKTKLIGGFLVVVAMLLVVFGVAYNGLTSMGNAADELADSASLDDAAMSMIIGLLEGMDVESRSLISGYDATLEPEFQASVDAFDAAEDTIRSLGTAEQGVLLDEMIIDHDNFQASVLATIGLVRDGKQGEAVSNSIGVTDPIIEELKGDLGELEEEVEAFGDTALANASSTESNAITVQIIMVIIASILAVSLGYWLARMISTGVGQMLVAAEGIADGDLDQQIDVKSKDEIGDMANAFTRMVDYLKGMAGAATTIADGDLTADVVPKSEKDVLGNAFSTMIATLRSTIGQVNDAATGMASASEELASAANQAGEGTNGIANATQQVASGAAEQTKSVEVANETVGQLASAIEQIAKGSQGQAEGVGKAAEIVSQVSNASNEMATNAQSATESARAANQAAETGLATVQQSVAGMESISEAVNEASRQIQDLGNQSAEIGKIISVIDDIAAQTNLLALNAAIEAARAGEQGRGFAVVADEVRTLAERVTDATKEIASLIEGVQAGVEASVKAVGEGAEQVAGGSELAIESGTSLEAIQKAVEDVTGQIEQISAAAEEVSASASEMVSTIESVNEIVQQNTAATEQMSASSGGVTSAIDEIASVTEQNSAAAQEVSASTEEVSAQVQQVVASSGTLSDMAGQLAEVVSQFRLSGDGPQEQLAPAT